MKTAYVLDVPRLIGTRPSSKALADTVPVTEKSVVLNFAATLSAAQGACDELVRELIQSRGIEVTAFCYSPRTAQYLTRAAILRRVSPLLTVISLQPTAL